MVDNAKLLDAQVAVLGSAMLDPRCIGGIMSALRDDDFTNPVYQRIFAAIRSRFQANQPVDAVTVLHDIGAEYKDLLAQILDVTPTAANCGEYVKIIREQAALQRVYDIGQKLTEATSMEDAQAILSAANGAFTDRPSVRIVSLEQGLMDFYERQQTETDYLHWGIDKLDRKMYTERGDFVVIGGRPSTGKTALALNFAWNMSETLNVGVFTLETKDAKIYDRLFANAADLSFGRIKKHNLRQYDYNILTGEAPKWQRRRLEVIPASMMTVQDIQAITLTRKYDVIFVDYLQLVNGQGHNTTERVANISIGLHNLAQCHGITVVALAQLSRPEKSAEAEKAPTMASLKESGQIEQDADAIMLLYLKEPTKPHSDRVLKIAKNKEGVTGYIELEFLADNQRFRLRQRGEPSGDEQLDQIKALGWYADEKK